MCAIVDANVRDEVFGNAASPAGKFFLDWLTSGKGKLVLSQLGLGMCLRKGPIELS